jgi:hypothetical protein
MSITASAGFARQPAAGDGYMLHATGKDSLPAKIILDSFGANVYSVFSGRSGRGTAAAPSATQANDIIARYSSSSYGGANSGFLQFGVGRMDFVATENHSDSNRGTEIQMWTVNNGSNTLTRTASFTGTSASFPGVVSANNLVVTGSITANVVSGNTLFSNLSTVTTTANAVVFNLQANIPSQVSGQLWYKSDIQALVFDTDIMGDRPGLGRTIYERVYNGSGANFPDGTFVRLAGLTTANAIPYVVLADATTAANSAVSGYIKTGIANGAYGYAYVSGVVETANTSAFQNGENIYLSTTPGAASNVAPYGPSIATVQVGKILYANNTTGKLQVQFNLVQAYGKANGSIMYANNNLMVASNTVNINEVAGTVSIANGIINTTRTLAGNQTAFNVNFTNDTIVRANISGTNLAITPTNFVAGKEVKVWVTNTAAGGRVVTHGCTAMNATGGSTTYNLPANATMFLRYMCFNNDLGNVYVSATF